MTARRDPLEVVDDMLRNAALARDFLPPDATPDTLYTGVVEFDPELSLFTGHVIDLRDQIYFEGASVEDLTASMRRAVDHYLTVCQTRGEEPERPFSGKLNLRLGPDLHRAAAVAAAAEGESLNTWLTKVVESAAGPMMLRERRRKR
jgi:predicted HicB family RNase H-like nuclease